LRLGERFHCRQRRTLGPCLVKLRFAQSITKQSDVGVVVGVVNFEPDRANALPQGMTSNVTGGLLDELYA
jgi:hypothetical protein